MRRRMALQLVRMIRWLDPTAIPVAGRCLAITEGHTACPLWQLSQEKKAEAHKLRTEASF